MVRFDIDATTAEVSIYLVPGRAGRPGSAAWPAAEAWLGETRPALDTRLPRCLATIAPRIGFTGCAAFAANALSQEDSPMNKTIDIGGRLVGWTIGLLFVIAEMSATTTSRSIALEIVEAAAASGAHALKIQTYMPDFTMTLGVPQRAIGLFVAHGIANSIDRAVSREATIHRWDIEKFHVSDSKK